MAAASAQSICKEAAGSRAQSAANDRILDVGCGPYKIRGAIGIDHTPAPGVDVVYDLDIVPWPFATDAFSRAVCRHSLAHLKNIVGTMEELHRILRPGGILEIVTPHFSSDNAFTDITSRWFFSSRSMDFFCANRRLSNYRYSRPEFELLEVRISFLQAAVFAPDRRKANPLKVLGIEAVVNRFPRIYEHFMAFLLRANEVYYRLRAVKESVSLEQESPNRA
ncbi:MAG TPA: methyltransferase domain-containing protein [Candidatus Acidoferrales bacterium]|nr:methyltransferase domain-containing protein [Candidatus Acidoferrales bacterium]